MLPLCTLSGSQPQLEPSVILPDMSYHMPHMWDSDVEFHNHYGSKLLEGGRGGGREGEREAREEMRE